jgi:hypothetical protein
MRATVEEQAINTLRGREKSDRRLEPVNRAVPPRRVCLAARSRLDQRERERERRVSDADASYYGPANETRTLKHAIPQRKHAKNDPLSKSDPVPLPRSPSKQSWRRPRRPTQNPTLCLVTARTQQTEASYTRACRCCQPSLTGNNSGVSPRGESPPGRGASPSRRVARGTARGETPLGQARLFPSTRPRRAARARRQG